MKKIIFLLSILFMALFVVSVNVHAYTLTKDITTYYYERNNPEETNYYAGTLKKFTIDGKNAYCLEPGLNSGTDEYTMEKWEHSTLSKAIQKDVALYAYYGVDYPGHQKLEYRAAVQALIWERILNDGSVVTFSTAKKGGGIAIDVSREKNEIKELVKNHDVVPSFNKTKKVANLGSSVTFTDTNNVLENFDIIDDGGAKIVPSGNNLTIYPTKSGTTTIKLQKKVKYDSEFQIFYSSTFQDVIVAGEGYPVYAEVYVETGGGKINLEKLDADNLTNVAQGEGSLQGAVYGIYDSENKLIEKLTTDKSGKATSKIDLAMGKYTIKEISPSTGYELDKTVYEVNVDAAKTFTVKVKEKVIKRWFQFLKVINYNETGEMVPEIQVEFGIFDAKNQKLFSKITDAEGKIEFELPYGHYTLKQLTINAKYEKLPDYAFEVLESGEETKVFADEGITSRLKIVKIDGETFKNIPLAHVKFKIFDVENQKYISQKISYPYQKEITIFETDENGVIITPEALKPGKYFLEEVDDKYNGYLWNQEKIEFTIDKNANLEDSEYGKILTINFPNYPVKGKIEIVKKGKYLTYSNGKIMEKEVNLEGVEFGLYASSDIFDSGGNLIYQKDKLIATFITDNNGLIKISDLPLGKYYVKELKTLDGYILDSEKHEIELNYQDEYTSIVKKNITIENKSIPGMLNFLKIDGETKKPLSNVLIEIYDEFANLVYLGKTDANGQINLNLPLGKYYLIEKEALNGYELNTEKVYFELTKDSNVFSYEMVNNPEKIKVEVPDTYLDRSDFSLMIVPFIGIIIYAKKKKIFN